MERRASDILLEIENRIKNVEKQLKLQEFQLKMIIDAFNRSLKIKEPQPGINTPSSMQLATQTAALQQLAPINSIAPVITPIISPDSEQNDIVKKSYSKDRKIVVFQKIAFSSGKPAAEAYIMIADTKGNLLKKVQANKNGLWQMAAVPGVYVVSVFAETRDGPEIIEYTQTFEIPNTADKPIELPVPTSTNKICV